LPELSCQGTFFHSIAVTFVVNLKMIPPGAWKNLVVSPMVGYSGSQISVVTDKAALLSREAA
jgi:hypothetical protein